jgi:hypothetical protein
MLDSTDPSLSLEVQTTTPVRGFSCFTLVSIDLPLYQNLYVVLAKGSLWVS